MGRRAAVVRRAAGADHTHRRVYSSCAGRAIGSTRGCLALRAPQYRGARCPVSFCKRCVFARVDPAIEPARQITLKNDALTLVDGRRRMIGPERTRAPESATRLIRRHGHVVRRASYSGRNAIAARSMISSMLPSGSAKYAESVARLALRLFASAAHASSATGSSASRRSSCDTAHRLTIDVKR